MNSTQIDAWNEGVGCSVGSTCDLSAANFLVLFQSVGAVVLLTYVAWLCVNAYKDYGNENISSKDMLSIWLRAIGMLMFLLFLLIN
jgi:integrating conjugative element protein (TIGR03758 family)